MLRRLCSTYKMYHVHGPLMLKYFSVMGFTLYPLFYLLRFSKSAPPYDDWPLRLVNAVMSLLIFSKDKWPEKLKPYFYGYSYLYLIVALPFSGAFLALKNGGGPVAIANTMMAVTFVLLLADWRNMIIIVALGFGSAAAFYVMTDPNPKVPMDYVMRLPILLVVMAGGSMFKLAGEKATAEKVRNGYASLAGSIAHEMRNPLSMLKHGLENIQRALPAPTVTAQPQTINPREVDELYRHLAHSEQAVKRGLQVISMTLDEVNAKPLDTSAFAYLCAADVCAKAVREFGYENEEDRNRVHVEVVSDFTFRGDETASLFVLFNLIKNALYYTHLYPDLKVTLRVKDNAIRVRDSGPGMAREVLEHLFEPFRTVGKVGGTGLGLAYCRRVMQAFGGQIACDSVPGEYTEFTLNFPPISEQESRIHRQTVLEKARTAFAGKRLLIVDDDSALRMTTRHKLQPLGAHIDEAADGQRALQMMAQQPYDLVVLDLNMPVLDGYAVAERIRVGTVPLNQGTCIVAYSSEPMQTGSVKAQKAGMDGFVAKPCAQLPLIQALHEALEMPAARPRLENAGLSGRRVLLADDSAYNRKAVAAYLRRAGVDVVEADSGPAVLAQLEQGGDWAAVLMDINMPGMSGLEATQRLRQSQLACNNVPVIALTAHSDAAMIEAAHRAGMNDLIVKPVEAGVLYATLRRMVEAGGANPPRLNASLSATVTAAAAPLLHDSSKLLDQGRLDSYKRMGMLDELMGDYLPEIFRLVDKLDSAVARQDMQESLNTLHSLLGMSGEAGAAALYQLARRVYVPMLEERRWPAAPGWVSQLRALAEQTEQALKTYGTDFSNSHVV